MPAQNSTRVSARSGRSTSPSPDPASARLAALVPLCDAVARLLFPRAEVVLHDIHADVIRHIANPISGRRVGDRSLIGTLDPAQLAAGVIGPYPKRNFDGRRLKAVMAVIRDDAETPIGLVCVNFDIEAFAGAAEQIEQLVSIMAVTERPKALFGADWREQVNTLVGEFLVARTTSIDRLAPETLDDLLGHLDSRGVFAIRTAVPYVGSILGLSRATIYARLAGLREQPNGTASG